MNKLNKKLFGKAKKGFTLIELMIVIVIIGALTAIILPQFDASEAEAKDAGCDASNYGTLSQLSKYRSLNGVYPSRMHTGFEDAEAKKPMGVSSTTDDPVSALAAITAQNLVLNTTETPLEEGQADSLKAAGIVTLASGGFGCSVNFTDVDTGVTVRSVTSPWYELTLKVDGLKVNDAGDVVDKDGNTVTNAAWGGDEDEVTINGVEIQNYQYEDPHKAQANDTTDNSKDGIVVPLIIAPTTDWENWYDGDPAAKNPSRIQVAQVGGCPWLEGGSEFRYYIAFFKVYNDGTKAKLLGTACPECGSLNP